MTKLTWMAVLLVLAGCGDDDGGNPDFGTVPIDLGGGEEDGGPVEETDSGMTDPGLGGLVVNEIDANDEWVELFNPTPTPVALGGIRITDSDAGEPRIDRAFAFPAGYELGAGEYVLAVENEPPLDGLRTGADCPGDGSCIHTDWGVSDSSGETIFLLAPDGDDTALMTAEYPMMAVPDGESYCRIENGSGDFTACAPTPGAENTASP